MKKIVPILLVICTFLSAFSILTMPTYAVSELIAGGLIGLGMFCIGELLGEIGSQSGGALGTSIIEFQNIHNDYLHSSDSILIEYHNSKPTFVVNPSASLSDVEYNITQEVVAELNNTLSGSSSVWYNTETLTWELYPWAYSQIKTTIGDKVSKAIYKQYYEESGKNTEELAEILDKPFYKFDFVGPMPAFTTPESTTQVSVSKDGFLFSAPCSNFIELHLNGSTGYYYPSEDAAKASGCSNPYIYYKSSDGTEYWYGAVNADCYGGGTYIIYNGEIYYNTVMSYTPNKNNRNFVTAGLNENTFNFHYSIDGVRLSDVYNGGSFSIGAVINTTGEQHTPIPSVSPSENDFTSTTGGDFSVNRTDDENNVGLGIGLGLIGNSDILELNPDGTIKSVGGIDMTKLTDLISKIQSGDLGFENVKEYLELIAKYVSSGNLTAQEQAKILANVQANVASIADINIKSDYKFDVKTPDTIINKFPFCLPFDVYKIFNLLSAEPKTPKFTIPFEMEGVFKEEIKVDLSQFDTIAMIVRWFLYIIFILGLILVTNKLIGRG